MIVLKGVSLLSSHLNLTYWLVMFQFPDLQPERAGDVLRSLVRPLQESQASLRLCCCKAEGDWGGGAQTRGRFEEEVNGPELGAKKCFKCQNPRAEDCCERSRSQGQDEETGQDQDQVGGGEPYGWRGDNGHGRTSEWEADDEEDLCGWDGDQAFSYAWESREEDQKWNPEWRQAREEEQLRSLALWGVKGRDVFNIGPQYVVGKTTGLEAFGTPVLKSLLSIPILEGRQQ